MAIDPKLLVIKPVDELERVTGLQDGDMLFYDGSSNLKRISIDTFNNLSKTAKPLKPTDPAPSTIGLYSPTTSGTYSNAGGLIAQEGYYTQFYFDGTIWTKIESKFVLSNNTVTPEMTTFSKTVIVSGKNKANPANRHNGYYVNWDYGNIDVNTVYDSFADLPISPDTIYFMPGVFHYAWKKINGDFISGENVGGASVSRVSPIDAAFISFDVIAGTTNVQLEEGTVATAYEPYFSSEKVVIPNLYFPNSKMPDIYTLNKIYWAPGRQLSVFYDNVVMPGYAIKLDDYLCEMWAGMGSAMQRLYRSNPTADTWYRVIVEDGLGEKKQKDTIVSVAGVNSGSGITRKVLTIGDSTVNAGVTLVSVRDYFNTDVMDVNLIGTRTTLGVNHEGRPGWSFENYMTSGSTGGVTNPFWDGTKFDFTHYMTASSQSMSDNDLVFIQLGINDLFPSALIDDSFNVPSQISLMKGYLSGMISSIKAYNSNIRIAIVMPIPPSIDQDATGFGLGNSIYVIEKYVKHGLKSWWSELLSTYDNDTSASNKIHLVPANMIIDRKYDFPTTTIPIDAYNTNTISIQSDGIHLTDPGYKKVGDTYIGLIKYFG